MRNDVGMPFGLYASATLPVVSKPTMNFAGVDARNFSASSRLRSTVMPTICSPRAPYFACMSFIHGNDCLQGEHHEAQKST